MSGLGALIFLPAFAYQIFSIAACLRHKRRRDKPGQIRPPVSILKPVRGIDPGMCAALRSQAAQHYPEFEILFGVADEHDPAVPLIQQLQRDFPRVPIALYAGSEPAANAKVGTLARLSQFARFGVWVVSDSDILVTPEYLEAITAPLSDSAVGVVTCLYRAAGHSPASRWEALGVAIDFMPSTLVARLAGVREFGFGSTLCFRAADLQSAGGFAGFTDYIADDYQLARRLVQAGRRAHISSYIVETSLGDGSWRDVWQHQLRWARTIRATKGAGFAGLPVTHAGIWAAIAASLGMPLVALALIAARIAAALASGWLVLRLRRNPLLALLAPVWDLYAFCVWAASYASRKVVWRGRQLRIRPDGRIEPDSEPRA
jgi:ceramide glucosyltransferase